MCTRVKCWRLAAPKIHQQWCFSHSPALLSVFVAFTLYIPPLARTGPKWITLSQQDVLDVIASYHSIDPAKTVAGFRQKMPPPVVNEEFRSSILPKLSVDFARLRLDDPQLTEAVRKVFDTVLALYNRTRVYEIVIIHHPAPLMMIDSGVALLISTGMIERAKSDDELLGYTAHEVGHEFILRWAFQARQLLHTATLVGNDQALIRKAAEAVALIELECDAFASLTLASLGRNPLAFIDALEQAGRDFPDQSVENHPPYSVRRSIVSGVVPTVTLTRALRRSESFRVMKESLSQLNIGST